MLQSITHLFRSYLIFKIKAHVFGSCPSPTSQSLSIFSYFQNEQLNQHLVVFGRFHYFLPTTFMSTNQRWLCNNHLEQEPFHLVRCGVCWDPLFLFKKVTSLNDCSFLSFLFVSLNRSIRSPQIGPPSMAAGT